MTKHLPVPVPAQTQQRVLPAGNQIVRAGLSGAAVAGTWTGIYEAMRVRNGEIGTDEAVRTTVNSVAIGAGAGAVAQVVGQVARSIPLLALAVAAAGVLYLANQPKRTEPAEGPEDAR